MLIDSFNYNVDERKAWYFGLYGFRKDWLQNVEVYIGEDPDAYSNNHKCPGGSFLNKNDSSNFYTDGNTNNFDNDLAWVYGFEVWCNIEGRYTHIVADLSHQKGEVFT